MNQALDGLLRRPALRIKKGRAVVTFNDGNRSFFLQYFFQADQCLDGIPQMFKDETDEYVIKGFMFEGKVKNVGDLERDVRDLFLPDQRCCCIYGGLRDVDGGKARPGAVPGQDDRLRTHSATDLQNSAAVR